MTSGDWSPQLSEFIELFYALQIVTPDNLPDDAFEIPDEFNERTIFYQDAAELVTCIVRTDRFVDGLINKYINNRWLTRLARVLYSRRLLQENGWPKSLRPGTSEARDCGRR